MKFRCFKAGVLAIFVSFSSTAVNADDRAGETASADPDAFQQSGLLPEFLNVGSEIIRNARVFTQETGSLELVFDDGARLSMGSNTEVVIDDYVYDPEGRTSRAIFELGRGVLRVVSGRIPSERVGVKTPVATVGIRGTEFLMDTRTTGNMRVWVDVGTVVVAPDQGSQTFELVAPAFASCSSTSCEVGDAPVQPTTAASPGGPVDPSQGRGSGDGESEDHDDDNT